MEKFKKILTDPKLVKFWQGVKEEMMGEVPSRHNVSRVLKELGLGKKLMTEYGEIFYLMCVMDYVGDNEEGSDFEWVNKDTLEMKKLYESEIYSAKQSILYSLNRLCDLQEINEETLETALSMLNIEEEDEDYE